LGGVPTNAGQGNRQLGMPTSRQIGDVGQGFKAAPKGDPRALGRKKVPKGGGGGGDRVSLGVVFLARAGDARAGKF